MFDEKLQRAIAFGLDHGMATVFLGLFKAREHSAEELAEMRLVLNEEHWKSSRVKPLCMELRLALRAHDAPVLHFAALDILEAYAANLAANKLKELLRREAFRRRQVAMPWA